MKLVYHKLMALLIMSSGLFVTTSCQELLDVGDEIADLIRDDGSLCLNDFLDALGLDRDDLGADADEELQTLLSEQEEALGMAYVIDCAARDQVTALTERPIPMVDYCDQDPCGGNGTCNSEERSCECNEGYTGFDCARCDAGYDALEDGSCAATACADDSCGAHGLCSDLETEGAWNVSCACGLGYDGDSCGMCAEGYGALMDGTCSMASCTEASCSSRGTCSEVEANGAWTNGCECNEGFTGDACEEIAEGYVLLSTGEAIVNPCNADSCNGKGECDWNELPEGGVMSTCFCETGYTGDSCDACDETNLFFDDAEDALNCVQSECPQTCRDSATGSCDDDNPANTACICDDGYAGADCTLCATGFANIESGACVALSCTGDSCSGNGACTDSEADGAWAATCACNDGYTGDTCTDCAEGYVATENGMCMMDTCTDGSACGGNGSCEWNAAEGTAGECTCEGNFTGATCGECAEGFVGEACGTCDLGYIPLSGDRCILDPCGNDGCSEIGDCSVNDEDGSAVCDCPEGYTGASCETCADGFEGHPDCQPLPPPEPEPTIVEECDDPSDIVNCLAPHIGAEMREDVMLLIDVTGSMRDDRDRIESNLSEIVDNVAVNEGRFGVAWYKDNQSCNDDWYGMNDGGLLPLYGDDAMMNQSALQEFLAEISVRGGCDLPESMLDAIYDAVSNVSWASSTSRALVILTDAGFHTGEKSNHTQEEIDNLLAAHGVSLRIVNVALAY